MLNERFAWGQGQVLEGGQVVPAGWRSGCPVCGYHDAVRQLDAVYQDRERRLAEQPPIVNRFGLFVRGHTMLSPAPRVTVRLKPPRRPSAVGTYAGSAGPQVAALVGVPAAVAWVVRPDTYADLLLSVIVAFVLGVFSQPMHGRGKAILERRTADWEAQMQKWRALRYCSRCDQVFSARG